jgi:hypothetical protein
MFISSGDDNIISLVSFLLSAKMLGGDGPWGREIDA